MFALVDTSIWISFFNNSDSPISEKLASLIEEDLVVICPTIFQEILQGTKDQESFNLLNQRLSYLTQLKSDPYEAAVGAAEIYFRLRKKGITIRKSNDCLIAWFAMKFNVPIWHQDRDFNSIASTENLKIYTL